MNRYVKRTTGENVTVKLVDTETGKVTVIYEATGKEATYTASTMKRYFKRLPQVDENQLTFEQPAAETTEQPEEEEYTQLCVWMGTLLGDVDANTFEKEMFKMFGAKVKFAEEVVTLPCPAKNEGGGRHDLFFYVRTADIYQFAIKRLAAGIRWWEDVLANGYGYQYPKYILDKYPETW